MLPGGLRLNVRRTIETQQNVSDSDSEWEKASTDGVLTWSVLREVHARNAAGDVKALEVLARTPAVSASYREATRALKAQWATVGDALLVRHFAWASKLDKAGLLCAVQPKEEDRRLVWSLNDYPYGVEDGTDHHLIWSAAGSVAASRLDALIEERRPAMQYESICLVNPSRLQSVRNVWHAHVFSRQRRADDAGRRNAPESSH
jgi:hypothetical protein